MNQTTEARKKNYHKDVTHTLVHPFQKKKCVSLCMKVSSKHTHTHHDHHPSHPVSS